MRQECGRNAAGMLQECGRDAGRVRQGCGRKAAGMRQSGGRVAAEWQECGRNAAGIQQELRTECSSDSIPALSRGPCARPWICMRSVRFNCIRAASGRRLGTAYLVRVSRPRCRNGAPNAAPIPSPGISWNPEGFRILQVLLSRHSSFNIGAAASRLQRQNTEPALPPENQGLRRTSHPGEVGTSVKFPFLAPGREEPWEACKKHRFQPHPWHSDSPGQHS